MNSTDSAYYPVFRSMFRNVVAALDEALDITLFLKCLANHFVVSVISPKDVYKLDRKNIFEKWLLFWNIVTGLQFQLNAYH